MFLLYLREFVVNSVEFRSREFSFSPFKVSQTTEIRLKIFTLVCFAVERQSKATRRSPRTESRVWRVKSTDRCGGECNLLL